MTWVHSKLSLEALFVFREPFFFVTFFYLFLYFYVCVLRVCDHGRAEDVAGLKNHVRQHGVADLFETDKDAKTPIELAFSTGAPFVGVAMVPILFVSACPWVCLSGYVPVGCNCLTSMRADRSKPCKTTSSAWSKALAT